MVRRPISEEAKALTALLDRRGVPKAGPCSPYIRNWWESKGLPTLMDQALSELRRFDEFQPKLLGFMRDGSMGVVDISSATGGQFGDARSKDATAAVHQFSARIPGIMASVFCVETWILRSDGKDPEKDELLKNRGSIANHPDRGEAMMFNMLHCDPLTNTMMQLTTMREVIKVLGVNRSRKAWADTKYADLIVTTDPMGENKDGEYSTMKGRFIYGDDDNGTN